MPRPLRPEPGAVVQGHRSGQQHLIAGQPCLEVAPSLHLVAGTLLQPALRELERLGVPHALFINKMDQARGSLQHFPDSTPKQTLIAIADYIVTRAR